jgi:CSLREA domain-containing protein
MFTLRAVLRLVFVLVLLGAALPVAAASSTAEVKSVTFTVNSDADTADANTSDFICDVDLGTPGEQCTLRAAIYNANKSSGADRIEFSAVMTISPASPLPQFSSALGNTLTIDGNLQVTLDGSGLTPGASSIGFHLAGDASTVQGMIIQDFSYGIKISGNLNTVGVDDDDMSALGEKCVIISNDSVAVNGEAGVWITGNYNLVAGNIIGLNLSNNADGNETGVRIEGDFNLVGTDGDGRIDADEGNWISGNAKNGVLIVQRADAHQPAGNVVAGNIIGLDATGAAARANGVMGVFLDRAGNNNIIGTDGDGSGDSLETNIISANLEYGIYLYYTNQTTLANNKIGSNAAGTATGLGNGMDGIHLEYSDQNILGTDGDGVSDSLEGNLISANGGSGVSLIHSDSNTISGNSIGFKSTGIDALANEYGVYLELAQNNLVGSDGDGISDALEGNVISGNRQDGIYLNCQPQDMSGNVIAGNIIGLRPSGDVALPNAKNGVYIYRCVGGNQIGGSLGGQRNIISGNTLNGIFLEGADLVAVGNNWIGRGTDMGDNPLGNQGTAGVLIAHSPSSNADGNTLSGNVIAHNAGAGIRVGLDGSDPSTGNRLDFNSVYNNGGLGIDLGATGWNPIDPQDVDSGPNGLQNAPDLYAGIAYNGILLQISGLFNSAPNQAFTLSFYRSSSCDASGYGEGRLLVSNMTLNTDADGEVTFSTAISWPVIAHDDYITALATAADGSSSEFSNCRQFTGTPPTIHPLFLPAVIK